MGQGSGSDITVRRGFRRSKDREDRGGVEVEMLNKENQNATL